MSELVQRYEELKLRESRIKRQLGRKKWDLRILQVFRYSRLIGLFIIIPFIIALFTLISDYAMLFVLIYYILLIIWFASRRIRLRVAEAKGVGY